MTSGYDLPDQSWCLMCAGLFESCNVCTAGAGCIYAAVMISVCILLPSPVCVDTQNAAKEVFFVWHVGQMGS